MQVTKNSYGTAFRHLRIDRGYSLKEAAGNIITPQMLGVFEKGKSNISLYNFDRLLIRIGATWEDFFRYYDGEAIFKELALAEEIATKIHSGHHYDGLKLVDTAFDGDYSDNPILKTVYKLSLQSYLQTLSLTSKLTTEELQVILNYLNRIDTWGIFEYSILSYVLSDCPYEMIKYRADKLLDAIVNNKQSLLQTKKEDINILINMIGYFSTNQHFQDANHLITSLDKALKKSDYLRMFTEKFNLKFYQAMNLLRQNNPKGLDIARDCLRFLEAYEALDNSNASAIDKNNLYSAVTALNKTGLPFTID